MKTTTTLIALTASLVAIVPAANAQVSYTATDISGSTWEYNYTVTNNLSANLGEFTTFFTLGLYTNLQVVSAPGNWQGGGGALAINPDPSLPADGFFDAQASDAGLAAGASQSGFSVEFTYLGTGTPGAQLFNFVDSSSFATLESGNTTLGGGSGGGTTAAPEIDPSSAVAAMTLLLGTLALVRGRNKTASEPRG
jgi:hypothetical protein